MNHNLYIIKSNGAVKLGFSENIPARIKAYNTHNHSVELISSHYRADGKEFERYFHKVNKLERLSGEWYPADKESYILECINSEKIFEKEKDFFYFNNKILGILYGQNLSTSSPKVFWWLLERYQGLYDTFAINKALKEEAAEKLKLTTRTIETALKELTDSNLLYKTNRSTYKVNAAYVWKGALKDRPNHLVINLKTND